ncbi:hypothetical protein [Methanoplanus limicola]|uniref:Uncharacterized protein n=1 Tax=Methanoplanus limicola DSM 2279 TaxID=937775 RepID=H1Z0V9_9EURY|nr:hypothetical protein [Methanoplanus limicola]EHQ36252.1 hypothetical protein Metlim_2184 [Methanoplanus limicola DSM 2279]
MSEGMIYTGIYGEVVVSLGDFLYFITGRDAKRIMFSSGTGNLYSLRAECIHPGVLDGSSLPLGKVELCGTARPNPSGRAVIIHIDDEIFLLPLKTFCDVCKGEVISAGIFPAMTVSGVVH